MQSDWDCPPPAGRRRERFEREEAFLAAEIRKPQPGTRLELQGAALYQIYTPAAYSPPMRCLCAMLRELPADTTVSRTYCACSRAFVEAMWSETLGRPVRVELIESAVSGSSECRFKIAL